MLSLTATCRPAVALLLTTTAYSYPGTDAKLNAAEAECSEKASVVVASKAPRQADVSATPKSG